MSYGIHGNGSGESFRVELTVVDSKTGEPVKGIEWPVHLGPYVTKGAASAALTRHKSKWPPNSVYYEAEIQEATSWSPIK
jgi:hypothetical protein